MGMPRIGDTLAAVRFAGAAAFFAALFLAAVFFAGCAGFFAAGFFVTLPVVLLATIVVTQATGSRAAPRSESPGTPQRIMARHLRSKSS